MIKLTRAAFLRRHSIGFSNLKRDLQESYLNQSQYSIIHRDGKCFLDMCTQTLRLCLLNIDVCEYIAVYLREAAKCVTLYA